MPQHFLTLNDLPPATLRQILARAIALKTRHARGERDMPLAGKVLGMIFEKASTRTRVSFETGMAQLGGHAIFLSPDDTQLGRGETVEDTARVLSRMVDAIMIRNHSQATLERFAEHSRAPVINGLTDRFHPCQLLADIQTFIEHRGDIAGATVAWIGDGNNMCNSYINAARQFDFALRIACPDGYGPDARLLAAAGDRIELLRQPEAAVQGADLVVTDVWASMGQEEEQARRVRDFAAYQVTGELMDLSAADSLFMHCLPAHRGEEVAAEVLDGPRSAVWDEAENRLHAQKALLEFLLVG
jgi:ornithine carbamoyltransferase